MRLISDSLIILMAFIILIAFTRLLIICHPFILKNLYFNLFSFRLFVSRLLTMVHDVYVSGKEDAEHGYIDLSELKAAIGQIKGIGENRLNEIMDVIQNFVDNAEKK